MNPSHKQSLKNTGRKHKSMATSGLLPTPTGQEVEHPQAILTKTGRRLAKNGNSHSLNLADRLTFSQAASPASPSPKPDEEKERTMNASSGLKCYGLFESSNPDGSLVKMLRDSLLSSRAWYSSKCALTWKRKDTKFSRLLFQLSPSMHPTAEIESGLLQTPNAMETDGRGEYKDVEKLKKRAGKHQLHLSQMIAMLPTPQTDDADNVYPSEKRRETLVKVVNGTSGTKTGLKLQPAFVEWMMGYPKGWTEIPDSKVLEMRLSRRLQKKSSK